MFHWNLMAGFVDNLLFSLQTAAIGIIMVFVILALLVAIISLFKAIANRGKKPAGEPAALTAPEPVAEPPESGISPETVAAIMAAVNCMYEQERPGVEFVVRSIKRKY